MRDGMEYFRVKEFFMIKGAPEGWADAPWAGGREGSSIYGRINRKLALAIEKPVVGFWRDGERKLLFVAELVANAPDGQHHLRILRVLFDLGSQSVDV